MTNAQKSHGIGHGDRALASDLYSSHPSHSTRQNQKSSFTTIFPINLFQGVSRCFNPFQAFFRKKRLFKIFAGGRDAVTGPPRVMAVTFSRPFTANHALSRLFTAPRGRVLCASLRRDTRVSREIRAKIHLSFRQAMSTYVNLRQAMSTNFAPPSFFRWRES